VSQLPPFFVADGDRFIPSASARGPWSARHQHGGPPAALLARAFARQAGPDAQIARLTFDFLRPVPLAPLTVATRVVRAGAKVQRLAGTVLAEDGTAVIEATCLVMRVAPNSVAVPLETRACPAPPAESAPFELPFMSGDKGYHRAVEWRLAKGPGDEGRSRHGSGCAFRSSRARRRHRRSNASSPPPTPRAAWPSLSIQPARRS
jgi:hypothetical protein